MTEMERALTEALDLDLKAQEPVQIASRRPQTIAEQVQQLERVEREIANRLRREGVEAEADAARKVADAHAHYNRQLSEETARLQRERDEQIRQATDAYYGKLHELEGLLRRRN